MFSEYYLNCVLFLFILHNLCSNDQSKKVLFTAFRCKQHFAFSMIRFFCGQIMPYTFPG